MKAARLYRRFILTLFVLVQGLQIEVLADIKPGGDFSLTDHYGDQFELQQYRGTIVLLFFGYTSCPDVCPNELSKMAQVLSSFEGSLESVRGLFITIDPERDTPQKLEEYISYFGHHLLGLTGTSEQVYQVADLYQADYKIKKMERGKVDVNHSSNLYIIDKKGEINTMVPFGMSADHIIKVVSWLLKN